MVKEADKTPLQKDPDYAQAFTQVVLAVEGQAIQCIEHSGRAYEQAGM